MITRLVNRRIDASGRKPSTICGCADSTGRETGDRRAVAEPCAEDAVSAASSSPTPAVAVIIRILPNGQFC